MSTPEGKTKDIIKKYLKTFVEEGSLYYFMPVQGKFAKKGVPDFLLCYKGKFIGIEAKADGKSDTTTALQELTISQIKIAGGIALVISNKLEMEKFVEEYLN